MQGWRASAGKPWLRAVLCRVTSTGTHPHSVLPLQLSAQYIFFILNSPYVCLLVGCRRSCTRMYILSGVGMAGRRGCNCRSSSLLHLMIGPLCEFGVFLFIRISFKTHQDTSGHRYQIRLRPRPCNVHRDLAGAPFYPHVLPEPLLALRTRR